MGYFILKMKKGRLFLVRGDNNKIAWHLYYPFIIYPEDPKRKLKQYEINTIDIFQQTEKYHDGKINIKILNTIILLIRYLCAL
jgi:hypothetical protein